MIDKQKLIIPQLKQDTNQKKDQETQNTEFDNALTNLKKNPNKRTHGENVQIVKVMMQTKFFKELAQNYGKETVEICCSCLRYKQSQPGQVLFKQGRIKIKFIKRLCDIGDAFYIIVKGQVGVNIKTYLKVEDISHHKSEHDLDQYDSPKIQHSPQIKSSHQQNLSPMKTPYTLQKTPNKIIQINQSKRRSIENVRRFSKQTSSSFLEIGSCHSLDKDKDREKEKDLYEQKILDQPELQEVKILKAGDSFGELALMKGTKGAQRAATIISKELTHYAYMVKDDFQNILKDKEQDKLNQSVAFFSKVFLFQGLEEDELRSIFLYCSRKDFKKNNIVYNQNDTSDFFYIVKSGDFQLLSIQQIKDKKDVSYYEDVQMPSAFKKYHGRALKETAISILTPGQYFGHIEILKKAPRKYTVKCLSSEGELYVLSQSVINTITLYPQLLKLYLQNKRISQERLIEDRQMHSELYDKQDEKVKETNEQNSHLLLQNSYDKQYYDKIINYTKRNSVKLPSVIQCPISPRKSIMLNQLSSRQDFQSNFGGSSLIEQLASPRSQMNTSRSKTPPRSMRPLDSSNLSIQIFNKSQQDINLQKINQLFSSTPKESNRQFPNKIHREINIQSQRELYSFTPKASNNLITNKSSSVFDNQIRRMSLFDQKTIKDKQTYYTPLSSGLISRDEQSQLNFTNQMNKQQYNQNRKQQGLHLSLNLNMGNKSINSTVKEIEFRQKEMSVSQRQMGRKSDFFSSVFSTPKNKNRNSLILFSPQHQKASHLNIPPIFNGSIIQKHRKSIFTNPKQNSDNYQSQQTEPSELFSETKSFQDQNLTTNEDQYKIPLPDNIFAVDYASHTEGSPNDYTHKFKTINSEPAHQLKYDDFNDSFTQELITKYQTGLKKQKNHSFSSKNKTIMQDKYFENHQRLIIEMKNIQEQEKIKQQQISTQALNVMNKIDGYRSLKIKLEGFKQAVEARSEKGVTCKESKKDILNRFFKFMQNQDVVKEQNKKSDRYQFTDFRNFEKVIQQKAIQIKTNHLQQKKKNNINNTNQA